MRISNEQVGIFIVLAHHFLTIFHITYRNDQSEYKEGNKN